MKPAVPDWVGFIGVGSLGCGDCEPSLLSAVVDIVVVVVEDVDAAVGFGCILKRFLKLYVHMYIINC